jgi:hypothetical protein
MYAETVGGEANLNGTDCMIPFWTGRPAVGIDTADPGQSRE